MSRHWPRIVRTAERQAGLVSLDQLRAAGVDARAASRLAATGVLTRRHRGVYVVGAAQRGAVPAAWAAQLAIGSAHPLSHLTAGHLLGLLPRPARIVEVTVVGGRRRPRPGIRIHHADDDLPTIRLGSGLLVTDPARTLVDLASRVGPTALRSAVRTVLVNHLVDPLALRQRLDERPHPGVRRLRAVLDAVDDPGMHRTASELERRLLTLLREHGLPLPLVNEVVLGLEVDFLWPDAGLIVEADGERWHAGDDRRRRDRERDAILVAAGYTVLRIGWHQLAERPTTLVDQLRSRLL
ncbi:type IV toxin-antitoxin system AbiEi family antitoxin domain-containing protein [Patulibacter defluvii]|uniref:type IV toxin-antitoxin system AbiEi family antitoxin domain-containing protein n=1 Tax=Patulibacter defluvii TaxID=3095358 RepID=UPI002A757741|nr:type IV toxin-antitoxin system AbiEi family antitoxin domain-containing protein [Patulibacter sp. DM4]